MKLSQLLTANSQQMESSLVRELLHYSQQPDILSFAGGLPDEAYMPAFPNMESVADSRQYGPSEGEAALREQVVATVAERSIQAGFDQTLITNGSQQGLDIVSRLILDSDSMILTEQPTYLAAIQVFKLQGAQIQDVAADDEGMSVSVMRELIDQHQPKAVYLIPNFQNPAGHCYSLKRRQEIAALLDEKGILLIEDDPYRDLCFEDVDRTPISSMLKTAPWIYMGSYSKVLWPGLRTGYLVSCPDIAPYLVKLKQATDLHTNRLGQNLIASYLATGEFPAHLERLQQVYKAKRDTMMLALDKYLGDLVQFEKPAGGMFVWLTLPEGVSSKKVLSDALEQKVLILPGTPFYPNNSDAYDSNIRLSFARVPEDKLDHSIALLADVIKAQMN
ncbi:PLP-dependent aminotransferase family protein [Marinomonas sp. S3726]|uniref:aminotransferase-like domain-containing protein n=1 Tax=Marinomonas sp. S3726 TaxID=579484 RepID=UPI0005FA415A|nr:PLP-dependent aminotransferase family protein [Marinomonas sp. S3726]